MLYITPDDVVVAIAAVASAYTAFKSRRNGTLAQDIHDEVITPSRRANDSPELSLGAKMDHLDRQFTNLDDRFNGWMDASNALHDQLAEDIREVRYLLVEHMSDGHGPVTPRNRPPRRY